MAWLLPKVPPWVETYHLTYMTVGWIAIILVAGYLARDNREYLWLMSTAVVGQYITDLLDGAVGRLRNTGLVRWGFYMDHFLDYCFLSSLVVAYWLISPYEYKYILFMVFIASTAYFVHTILYFGATGQFEIATDGVGPTEIRGIVIMINTMLIVFDKIVSTPFLMLFFIGNVFYLLHAIYIAQQKIWRMDMKIKNKRK